MSDVHDEAEIDMDKMKDIFDRMDQLKPKGTAAYYLMSRGVPVSKVISSHFHWRFWKPKECIGGPVYFGKWHQLDEGPDQSNDQVIVKREMGYIQ